MSERNRKGEERMSEKKELANKKELARERERATLAFCMTVPLVEA